MKMNFKIDNRKLRYGSYSAAIIVIFITFVIGINLIVNTFPASLDMTPNKRFSTSETTAEVLKDLDKEVTIYALFDEVDFRDNYVQIEKLMQDYAVNKNITIKYVDTYKNPAEVKRIDPDNFYKLQQGNFLFVSGDKKKKVTLADFNTQRRNPFTNETYDELAIEETLTGAIIFVTSDETPVIYFTQGHGEASVGEVSTLNEYLNRNNFIVKTIDTLTAEKIPEDADMIVFLSPQKDITTEERIKLQDFFDISAEKRKALMVFVDPIETGVKYSQMNLLLEKYNIRFNNDFVKENSSDSFYPGQPFYILPQYTYGEYRVFAPYSRSVEILQNKKEFITEEALLLTSTSADSIAVDTEAVTTGMKYIAVRTDYKGGYFPTRVFAIGNTAFLNDQIISNYSDNMQFILDQIRWTLMQEGSSIYIQGKPEFDTSIQISQKQATAISMALIIIVPLILFGIGAIIYIRRKNL